MIEYPLQQTEKFYRKDAAKNKSEKKLATLRNVGIFFMWEAGDKKK